MENKNYKILIVLVAILILLVIGVIIYLIYDKVNSANLDNNNNVNEVENADDKDDIEEPTFYTSEELFTMLNGNWASVSQKSDMITAAFSENHFMLGWFASEPFYSGEITDFKAIDINNYSFNCNGEIFYVDISDFQNGNINLKVNDSQTYLYEFVSTNQDDLFEYFGI